MSWWPFRLLLAEGLHPLWATVVIYALAVLLITLWRPVSWRELFATPVLWVLVLASGTTNAAFNWAVTIGDVVRVILLFYLMPLWAVLLARWLLHERITSTAMLRVALAMAGAAVVMGPEGVAPWALPLPRTLAEWLAIVGGFSFVLNNVMLRREARRSEGSRALARFFGGALVAAVLATSLSSAAGAVPWPPVLATGWVVGALAMGAAFLAGNLSLQYGAARLPGNVTAVVMIAEVLFASVSAVLLGAGVVTAPLAIGGALIVAATLLAAREGR